MSTRTQIVLTHPDSESASTLSDILKRNVSGRQQALLLARFFEQLANGGRQASFTVVSGDLQPASVDLTFSDTGQVGDAVVVNGVTLTAVDADPSDDEYAVGVKAHAILDTSGQIVVTKVTPGSVFNGYTFSLVIAEASDNVDDSVLAEFTGTPDAIVLTITPNDGTNNSATPVTLTTLQVSELISTGDVSGLTITLTDDDNLRFYQTAAGGGAQEVEAGGEGDGLTGTFIGGTGSKEESAASVAAAINASTTDDLNGYVVASAASGVCTISSRSIGFAGNFIEVSEDTDADSVMGFSDSTLVDGTEPTDRMTYHCGF